LAANTIAMLVEVSHPIVLAVCRCPVCEFRASSPSPFTRTKEMDKSTKRWEGRLMLNGDRQATLGFPWRAIVKHAGAVLFTQPCYIQHYLA
jgi:hypothetical protein